MLQPTYDEWCEDWFLAGMMGGERQYADIDPELLAEYEARLEQEDSEVPEAPEDPEEYEQYLKERGEELKKITQAFYDRLEA